MELGVEELKKIELNILEYIDHVCEENHIRYYLYAGSLLGAIRHKGFIPWDDDIDIALSRNDYEKFKEVFKNTEQYKLISEEDDSNFYLFSKVVCLKTELEEYNLPKIKDLGVYVDVFPLDNLPNNEIKRKFRQKKIHVLRVLLTYSVLNWNVINHSPVDVLVWVLGHLIGTNRLQEFTLRTVRKENSKDTLYCDVLVAASNPKRTVLRSWFRNTIRVRFENKNYPIPANYDDFLKELYGDYMEMPPVEKRISNHNFDARLKEELWKI